MTISKSTLDKILEEQIEHMVGIADREGVDDAVKCEAAKAVAMLIDTYQKVQNSECYKTSQSLAQTLLNQIQKS